MKKNEIKEILTEIYDSREKDSIKSDFGRTLLIGGSLSYPGAIAIASSFCYLSGNGYTAISVPSTILSAVQSKANPTHIYENFKTVNDSFLYQEGIIGKYDSLLFGNGVKDSKENLDFLAELIKNYRGNLVIDATGLMLLSKDLPLLKQKNKESRILLTPHLKEASRLMGFEISSRTALKYQSAVSDFVKEYQVEVLLKSADTVLFAQPEADSMGVYVSDTEKTPILARAGSGDGLAGLIAGYLAYADKVLGYEKTILFADSLFHLAAKKTEERSGLGTTSVLDVYDTIRDYRNL